MQTQYDWIPTAPATHIKRERARARQLKVSQWWRQQVGPGRCYHCGEKFQSAQLTMDHLVPLANGGKSVKANVVPACLSCNQHRGSKSDRPT